MCGGSAAGLNPYVLIGDKHVISTKGINLRLQGVRQRPFPRSYLRQKRLTYAKYGGQLT
ncbi:MAG: hypothetical protein OSB07_08700 [Dehalococcoidia bacterium]|nr:hypothetical protein [Dehalococcoidia bacterium]